MNARRLMLTGVAAVTLVLPLSIDVPAAGSTSSDGETTLVDTVRAATARYRHVENALADGYAHTGSCVSGPEEGAMGVHFAKLSLFDGTLDPETPEVLVYEPRPGGGLQLVAVEYVAPYVPWHAAHPNETPTLAGHLLHFVPGPNRYGADAFYELHVWAWRANPKGTFADWNPRVSCVGHQHP